MKFTNGRNKEDPKISNNKYYFWTSRNLLDPVLVHKF